MNLSGDGYREQGMRRALINELKRLGIKDQEVLNAFDEVPRHFFSRHGIFRICIRE